jgi:hypothetical protein
MFQAHLKGLIFSNEEKTNLVDSKKKITPNLKHDEVQTPTQFIPVFKGFR